MTDDFEALQADIPPEILAILGDATSPYSRSDEAERALVQAVDQAPDNLGLRIATYSFYFYADRLAEAIPHAEKCLALAAGVLGVPADWRAVNSDSADFNNLEKPQRVYLKSLVALGLCQARLGDREASVELLRKAASLDPKDRVKAREMADLVARGKGFGDEDEDD